MVWWQLKASIANRVCTASGDCAEFVAASAVEWGLASMETPSSLALFRHTTRITSARVHAACFARGCSALAARVRCRIIAQASGAMQCEAVRRVHLDSPITGALGPLMYSTAAQPLCPEAAAQPLLRRSRRVGHGPSVLIVLRAASGYEYASARPVGCTRDGAARMLPSPSSSGAPWHPPVPPIHQSPDPRWLAPP